MVEIKKKATCHICGSSNIKEKVLNFNSGLITSDSKGINEDSSLVSCDKCSIVSKNLTQTWFDNITQIYENYSIYSESNGAEKICFDLVENRALTRSETLLDFLNLSTEKHTNSRILDIGTGNGVFLKAVSHKRPDFSLFAQDLNDNYLGELQNISGFQKLITANVYEIDEKFDIVSMVHVLEHIPNPINFLSDIGKILSHDGILLVNVPDGSLNPIDLLVYDHCSHFSLPSLEKLLLLSGFEIIASSRDKIKRELIITARFRAAKYQNEDNQQPFSVDRSLSYLRGLRERAIELNESQPLFIFGASLAGNWLANELGQWDGCFVDEDSNKIGNFSNGHKIVSPEQVAEGTVVLIPLEKTAAASICSRLSCKEIRYEFIS